MTQQTTAERIYGIIREHLDFYAGQGEWAAAVEAGETIAAEIDALTRERVEARANAERWHSELEKCQSALRLSLAGTEQHYFASPARIDDVRAELAEARAEVERLRPAAEAWRASEAIVVNYLAGVESAGDRLHDYNVAAARARAAKGTP
jgi:uncharacterized coiled-coil DUF342 family protein